MIPREHSRLPYTEPGDIAISIFPFEKPDRVDIIARAVDLSVGGVGIVTSSHIEPGFALIREGMGDCRGGVLLWCAKQADALYRAGILFVPTRPQENGGTLKTSRQPTSAPAQHKLGRIVSILEERFRRLLESAPDGITIVNEAHEIVMVNRQCEKMTGYARDELQGQRIEKLLPDESVADHVRWRNEYIKQPKARPMGEHLNIFCRRKNGTMFPAEISLIPLETDEGIRTFATIRDITERKSADNLQRLAAAVFANTTEGIVVTDSDGTIKSVNKAFLQITGYSADEVVGDNPRILKSGLQDAGFYRWMWKTLRETGTWKGNFWNRRKNGEVYPQSTTINAIRNERGEITQYCGIFSDVTEQMKLEATLRMLSSTDGLTGLANRRTFDDTMQREWRRAQRGTYSIAIIMTDIDHFKKFNDAYGHLVGDDCLKKVATALKKAIRRAGDLAARYGGEEFVLLMPMTTINEATQIAEDIRTSVESMKIHHKNSDVNDFVTLSLGAAAVVPRPGMSAEDLINEADKALYRAKGAGRNRAMATGA
jgi:diguanylate cyclase (GGDEF)-like protein/PAS domain S-box-containing protein